MKRFSVIGNPIKHSKSPLLFDAIFKKLDINASYTSALLFNNQDVKKYMDHCKKENIKGINITMPFKEYCLSLTNDIDQVAKYTQSINCMHFQKNKIIGYNNDYYGFKKLIEMHEIKIKNTNNIIIGSGGSARTIIFFLIKHGAKNIYILSRNNQSTIKIIQEFRNYNRSVNIEPIPKINKLKDCNLINCSPIGLFLESDDTILSQIPNQYYESIIDINYNIKKNYFTFDTHQKIDGKSMFIYQALKSLDIWFESNISDKLEYKYLEKLLC